MTAPRPTPATHAPKQREIDPSAIVGRGCPCDWCQLRASVMPQLAKALADAFDRELTQEAP